jgi:hypothetical protein
VVTGGAADVAVAAENRVIKQQLTEFSFLAVYRVKIVVGQRPGQVTDETGASDLRDEQS